MTRKLAALGLIAGSLTVLSAQQNTPPATAEIAGRVIDAGNGQPIAGATVTGTRYGATTPRAPEAVIGSAEVTKDYDIPIISDGGIRTSGDATKALAAGASSVMVGSLFGGTDESPGKTLVKNGKKFKMYRGMASFYASLGRKYREEGSQVIESDDLNDYVPEGVEAMVSYKGSVVDIIRQLVGGLRSGLSYCGAKTIVEMQKNAKFIKITSAGYIESLPHDVEVV
jgi:IMP dehydrogenase